MSADIASLGLKIDTSDVKKAVDDLDRLPTAGERAARAFKTVTDVAKEFASGFGQGVRQGWKEYRDGANASVPASDKAEKGIKDVTRAGKEQEGVLRSASGALKTLVAGYLSFQTVNTIVRSVIQNTINAEQEQAQLAAVLLSTGEAAGFSRERLNEMADALAKTSTYSAGAINSAQTRLLSYTGIVGEVFPEAMQATIDMAARMGMSLEQSAETIGRALDIPSQGLTALTRQGFRFTEEQKKVVQQLERTGKVGQAQQIILDALKSSYGGAAAAARDTFGGAVSGLRKSLEDLTTGKDGSFNAARDGVNSLTDTLNSPHVQQGFSSLIAGVAKLVEWLTKGVSSLANFTTTAAHFVGIGFGQLLNGPDDPINRIDARVTALRETITSLQNTLDGPKKFALPLSSEEIANINDQLGTAKKELNSLLGMRADLTRQAANSAAGAAGNPFAPDRKVTPPKATGLSDKELKQLNAARLAADLAGYQRQLKEYVGAFTNAERLIDAARADSQLTDQQYYRAKIELVRLNEEAQVKALEQEKKRLEQQKLSGAELIKNQTRIKDIEAEIAGIRNDAGTQVQVLATQEVTALRKVTNAYEDARAAAKDYLDTIARQNQREIDGMGRGNQQRQIDARRNQRDDQFLERRTALDRQLRANEITREQYEVYLQIEKETHERALAEDDRYWSEKLKKQQDWSLGASEAIRNYLDEANDIYGQVERAFTSAFQGMEDALVKFVTTGKLDFKSLADSIIADITRIIIKQQVMAPLLGMLGLGGGSGGGIFEGVIKSVGGSIFLPSAKGNVFNTPALSAYSGQIVDRPTVFPFAKGVGLMGEAGPEAILPLKRGSDGKLGVEAGNGQRGFRDFHLHQTFAPGTDYQTMSQAAVSARRALERGNRNM